MFFNYKTHLHKLFYRLKSIVVLLSKQQYYQLTSQPKQPATAPAATYITAAMPEAAKNIPNTASVLQIAA